MKHVHPRSRSGQSLIIVLCFVTLFIGLALLLLLRSNSAAQLSSNSISSAKALDLALSGGDIIIGDFRQEIIDGSTSTTYGSGANTYVVYQPKDTGSGGISTAVPAITGFTPTIVNGVETDGLANLIKISQNATPFYNSSLNANFAGDGVIRASAASSRAPSLDGRLVTPARWNSHYLIGRAAANQGLDLNPTPVSTFPSPDWVIVTRSGASKSYSSADLPKLQDTANSEFSVGRFAYAVYNEGGTLDMNAAGYPSSLTPQQVSQKTSIAYADLKQLGLTQSQVDQIVGWRNPYTSQLGTNSSQFGSVAFNPASASSWLNNFANYNYCQTDTTSPNFGKKKGFLSVNTSALPAATGAPRSDQMLVSRQQLIRLVQSQGLSSDILQYMGTFSRSLEQPSYTPHPARPRIVNVSTPPPTAGGSPNESKYAGNNDAAGGDDIINPAFLSIRVKSAFTRLNGQQAVPGEPLVLNRFPLNYLSMVTYSATNSSLPAGFTASASDSDPIYNYFGLKSTDPSSPWVYNHGSNVILTLDKVAAAGREPDFAELLKAAIIVGALGKGAPNLDTTLSNYQYTLDTSVDYQVLQIMANLIDQQDSDSYPTCIQINSGPGGVTTLYGAEDLPYFYRYHVMSVVEDLPDPLLNSSDVLSLNPIGITQQSQMVSQWDFPSGNIQPSTYISTIPPNTTLKDSKGALIPWSIKRTKKGNLVNAGKVAFMMIPNLWNPYDPSTATNNPSLRPAQFRIYAQTSNPSNLAKWRVGICAELTGYYPDKIIPQDNNATPNMTYYWPVSSANELTVDNTEMQFNDINGTLFREPTLLWSNAPWKSDPTAFKSKTSVVDANTKRKYNGMLLGKAPVSFEMSIKSTPAQPTVDGSYVVQGSQVSFAEYILAKSGGYPQVTFVLQYLDASGKWVTYHTCYPDYHGLAITPVVANAAEYTKDQHYNPFSTNQFTDCITAADPRTPRWGMATSEGLGAVAPGNKGTTTSTVGYLLEPLGNKNVLLNTQASNDIFKANEFTVMETSRPRADKANHVNYSVPGIAKNLQMRIIAGSGFSASLPSSTGDISPLYFPGLLTQNDPNVIFNTRSNKSSTTLYFEDADGICRRAMGAYANVTMTDASTSSLAQPITSSPTRIGLPMATACTFNTSAVGTPTQQCQSRPVILNRGFRSVSEMSYAFTGTPWKNIDFFTPESGFTALLDTFCVGLPPVNSVVGGKVDLNTRQNLVLQCLIAGAGRDEWYMLPTPPAYVFSPITPIEAAVAAQRLVAFTSNTTDIWRGPLSNVSHLVGRYVPEMSAGPTPIAPGAAPDWFTYIPPTPVTGQNVTATYSGFTGLLDTTVYTDTTNSNNMVSPIVQRFRESALRPLADCGQTRVWNLMIDVIAQTGKYPKSATTLDQFVVEGEKRLWIHVAIDRLTGEIIDKQIEVVAQ
ncbi:MAG TPA: hypothetical protein VLA04_05630 [Verrucomicrobiae bacterium]|nr:hypothetical protein [Verrucomicrobiae bacterium]